MRSFICLGVAAMLVFAAVDGAAAWQIVQLTDNDYDDMFPGVSGGNVAWEGGSGYEAEIFLYDGAAVRQLTDNSFTDSLFCLDGNRVAWKGWGDVGSDVFLFDGQTTQQITNGSVNVGHPVLWDGGVAWVKYRSVFPGIDSNVFNYDGTSTVQLTDDDYAQKMLDASGKYVGWATDAGDVTRVMRYDGQSTTQVTEVEDTPDFYLFDIMLSEENVLLVHHEYSWTDRKLELFTPEGKIEIPQLVRDSCEIGLCGSRVVWSSRETTGHEIFLWDDGELMQITDNDKSFHNLCVSDQFVAWSGWDGNDYEIFLYDGTSIKQVTDSDSIDADPQISDSTLAWQHWDGNDWEIQMTTVPEPGGVVLLLLTGLSCLGAWRAAKLLG